MARRKYTVKQVAAALEKAGGYKTHAAKHLGCSYQTVLNYMEWYPQLNDVLDAIVEANKDVAEYVVQGIMRRAAQKLQHPKACKTCGAGGIDPTRTEADVALKYLRYKGQDRGYVERSEISGINGGPIETQATGVVLLPPINDVTAAKKALPVRKKKASKKKKVIKKKRGS